MKVVCAWCERQGESAVLHEKAPAESGVSHGICDAHAQVLLDGLRTGRAFPRSNAGKAPIADFRPRRLDSAREIVEAGAASGGREE